MQSVPCGDSGGALVTTGAHPRTGRRIQKSSETNTLGFEGYDEITLCVCVGGELFIKKKNSSGVICEKT